MSIVSLLIGIFKTFGFIFEIFSERNRLNNTVDMKNAAILADQNKINDLARKALEKENEDEIRRLLSV